MFFVLYIVQLKYCLNCRVDHVSGVIYLDDCPAEPHIPIYLIVGGNVERAWWAPANLLNSAPTPQRVICVGLLLQQFVFMDFPRKNSASRSSPSVHVIQTFGFERHALSGIELGPSEPRCIARYSTHQAQGAEIL